MSSSDGSARRDWPRALLHRALQSLPLGALGRRIQRRLGFYDGADFLEDLGGAICQIVTPERFIQKLLDIEDIPAVGGELPNQCVSYMPWRLSDISDLIQRMDITDRDEFWDIGCGLGGVSMLVAWLTGAHAHGVEFHHEYVDKAMRAAHAFHIPNIRFIHANACDVEYASGNKFFMYLPFTDDVQRTVFWRLRTVAERHPITVAWAGPLADFSHYPWLLEVPPPSQSGPVHSFSLRVFTSQQ